MHKSLAFLLVLALAAGFANLMAQTAKSGSTDVEEEYLWQAIEVQQITVEAKDISRDNKFSALLSIQAMIDEKRLGSEERTAEIVGILEGLAGEGIYNKVISNGAVINDYHDVRRQAVELLSKVGGKTAKTILVKVANEDTEPTVLAQAVYGLGAVCKEDDKDVLPYVVDVMLKNHANPMRDENLAFACLLAIEKLNITFKGVDKNTMKVLMYAAEKGAYNSKVKAKADQILKKMKKGGK